MSKHLYFNLDLTLTPTTFYCNLRMKYSHWTHSIAIGQSDNQTVKRQFSPKPSTSESLGQFLNKYRKFKFSVTSIQVHLIISKY